jgi:hypothetical protein
MSRKELERELARVLAWTSVSSRRGGGERLRSEAIKEKGQKEKGKTTQRASASSWGESLRSSLNEERLRARGTKGKWGRRLREKRKGAWPTSYQARQRGINERERREEDRKRGKELEGGLSYEMKGVNLVRHNIAPFQPKPAILSRSGNTRERRRGG